MQTVWHGCVLNMHGCVLNIASSIVLLPVHLSFTFFFQVETNANVVQVGAIGSA